MSICIVQSDIEDTIRSERSREVGEGAVGKRMQGWAVGVTKKLQTDVISAAAEKMQCLFAFGNVEEWWFE